MAKVTPSNIDSSRDIWIENYGAIGDGVTDNRTAILAAIAASQEATNDNYYYTTSGARRVRAGVGRFRFTGLIRFRGHTQLVGVSRDLTVFVCGDAAAQFKFGGDHSSPGTYWKVGGESGHFLLDGKGVALNPLLLDKGEGYGLVDVRVVDSAQDGVVFSYAQNLKVMNLEVSDCVRDGVVFDMGAGGISIWGAHIGRCGRNHVRFTMTAARPVGVDTYDQPANNIFWGGQIEYTRKVNGVQTATEMIYHGAGLYNKFVGTLISCFDAVAATSIIKMRYGLDRAGATELSNRLTFDNCDITGTMVAGAPAWVTGFDLGGSTSVSLMGRTLLQAMTRAYFVSDFARIRDSGNIEYLNVTSRFVKNLGVVEDEMTILEGLTFGGDTTLSRRESGLVAAPALAVISGAWNQKHLQLFAGGGFHHIWFDTTNEVFRSKAWAAPTSETDGKILSGAPTTATYITQTADVGLSAEQALSTLVTGLVKVTTGTGVLSTAAASDLPVHTHAGTTTGGELVNYSQDLRMGWFTPPGPSVINVADVTTLATATTGARYLGTAPFDCTQIEVRFLVTTALVTPTWAEVAIGSVSSPTSGSITLVGTASDVTTVVNTVGTKTVTINAAVQAGTDVYVLLGSAATTPFQIRRTPVDELALGITRIATTRPSTMAAPTSFGTSTSTTSSGYFLVRFI